MCVYSVPEIGYLLILSFDYTIFRFELRFKLLNFFAETVYRINACSVDHMSSRFARLR